MLAPPVTGTVGGKVVELRERGCRECCELACTGAVDFRGASSVSARVQRYTDSRS